MLNWLFGGEATPSNEPYEAKIISQDHLQIKDKETGEISNVYADNSVLNRRWRITRNEYYKDSDGQLRKICSYDNKGS
ncbi:MAG: hypothetical protein WAN66_23775 [Limnoraphis robusta]|uniref:Uncharacterized protein n=1 Tax=Limnoraphis robusta CS-951 TaxID=1637645 RepID=A0A0J9HM07_9CYAN|nr:hypothetical protein [Limnoraphis robusta]KMW70239.1 hypothetical protein WN50_36735 [Limnoraphis robusta CS-951]